MLFYLFFLYNLKGVTILAIGNGAPDLFTNFSAVSNDLYDQSFGQMFGMPLPPLFLHVSAHFPSVSATFAHSLSPSFLGATCFITMAVVGTVTVVSHASTPRRPFLRDIGFLTASLAFVMLVLYDGKIELAEGLGLIGIYVW